MYPPTKYCSTFCQKFLPISLSLLPLKKRKSDFKGKNIATSPASENKRFAKSRSLIYLMDSAVHVLLRSAGVPATETYRSKGGRNGSLQKGIKSRLLDLRKKGDTRKKCGRQTQHVIKRKREFGIVTIPKIHAIESFGE
ncbi:hypothetical protein CDAR_433301 [Caerostris darwini]|uniref:Ribosomal protein S13 n=1 Tax=Caerostris darwini TaxID=1538125 RepID=A0AAV4QGU3_9ARAC|nr:hypothetical protein CDAR_433301 [Caerostris darwini]